MPSLMNDAWILQISNLYDKARDGDLFRMVQGEKKKNFTYWVTKVIYYYHG
jgi:hypothetical protein